MTDEEHEAELADRDHQIAVLNLQVEELRRRTQVCDAMVTRTTELQDRVLELTLAAEEREAAHRVELARFAQPRYPQVGGMTDEYTDEVPDV